MYAKYRAYLSLLTAIILFLVLQASAASLLFAQFDSEMMAREALQDSPGNDDVAGLYVLQLSASGMTESAAQAFSSMIAQNMANTNRFKVIAFDEAEETIQAKSPELLPCFEIGCGIQIGKTLKVQWVVSGHISLLESGSFNLDIKLVHIQNG